MFSRQKNTLVLAVGLVAIAAALCLLVFLGVFRLPFGLVSAALTTSAAVDAGQLTLTGTTDLPDGAQLDCEVWHADGNAAHDLAMPTAVTAGRFACTFDIESWPKGTVTTSVRFRPYIPDQPASIKDRFGEHGERLSGAQLEHDSDGWELDARNTVVLR